MNPLSKLLLALIPLGASIFWDDIKGKLPRDKQSNLIKDDIKKKSTEPIQASSRLLKPRPKKGKKETSKKEVGAKKVKVDTNKDSVFAEDITPRVLREHDSVIKTDASKTKVKAKV